MANLIILAQQLHRQKQQIIKVQSIICSQRTSVAPIGFGHQFASVASRILLKLLGHPALIFGITDGPANLFGFKTLGIQTQLLGHNLFHKTLRIALVVNRELARPAKALRVAEFINIKTQ